MRRSYSVYILRCADTSYYVGITNDLARRWSEHLAGLHADSYTAERRPVRLVYSAEFGYVQNAIRFEKVVKAWSRRKKEALIQGDIDALRVFSKKRFLVKHKRRVATNIRALQEAMSERVWDVMG